MLSLLATEAAGAAEARQRFAISPRPYADALIEVGLQGRVSILGAEACGAGGQVGLQGVHTVPEALRRLLDGAPCTWRMLDADSVRIGPLPRVTPTVRQTVLPSTTVGAVTVTATKRPVLVGRLAAGVSVIPHNQIELTGAVDVTQTTGQLAGVLTTNLGPGRDKLLMRGLSDGAFTGRARSTVSTYLDDAPINYNAPDPALRLVDIDRVEVLRGPQGALYGSGAISGIYRIVTRKPELDRVSGGGAALIAATEEGSPSRELEAWVNVPLADGRSAARFVAYHDVQGGYLDDLNLRISNVDRTTRDGGRATLRFDLSDTWRVDLAANVQRLRSSDTQYTTVASPRMRSNRVREGHKNDFAQVGVTVAGEFAGMNLSSSGAYIRHAFSSRYDASDIPVILPPGATAALYVERSEVEMWVQDLVLRSSRPGPLSWLAGAYAARTDEETPGSIDVFFPVGTSRVYSEARRNQLREIALYAETSYEFAPGWTASAGGRWFSTRVRTSSDVVAVPPYGTRRSDQSRTFGGVSPKVSVQREFEGGSLLYALVSEGYRPGGFNTSGLYQIRDSRVRFEPDRLRNYEVGAKLRFLDRRLGLRTAAYFGEWRNIQTDQYRPSGLSYTDNVGDAEILGLEAELGYDFDFGLSLQANALVTESRLTRENAEFAPAVLDELPGVPNLSGGMLAIYERPLPKGLTLRVAGEASYVGRSNLSFNATLPSGSGEYVRAKLSAEVSADRWSAGVFVTNPTNAAGDTFAYGNPFSFGRVRQITPQRPRTVGLRLAAAF